MDKNKPTVSCVCEEEAIASFVPGNIHIHPYLQSFITLIECDRLDAVYIQMIQLQRHSDIVDALFDFVINGKLSAPCRRMKSITSI
jgi:hypothetical protein